MMPDMKDEVNLYIAPRMAEYSASKGGGSRHLLMNTGKERSFHFFWTPLIVIISNFIHASY